ncbi:hypothetical protein GWI33_000284 [Rhynchophorus ferrugineus]|uniref:Uncharacterized protein n=1 Tax=Rhynchophorus ferrugineus TaxID=354439 RepID=A0A834MHB1_RHYFE|nr:hypothetical protein GWI33_000284 [Rhynchophorus ferrugineus]
MAFANSSSLKTPTALEQLLEEINFQRTKEMRQLLKDDGGFVMLQGTTYWTDLFVRHFLFQNDSTIDCDDLLFFVRKKHVKGSPRYLPKFETEVDVFRKDSRKLPIGDPDIDWEETVYLNLIIHQFEYTLTLAICTRTSPKELQVLKRHSQQSSLSTKMAQRMTFGLFSNSSSQRCEFVRMKGPQGKGHAEMAVTKPKGSGVETPTSEPGFCATDMWDSDWEDDPEDFYAYRSQRRLSDPSANINNFARGSWRTKLDVKARSESEGLDNWDNGVSEIEAGDLRDGLTCPASMSKSSCCGCFQRRKRGSISLMEMYNRPPCASPLKCALKAPLGPPENKCAGAPHVHSLLNQSEYEVGKEKSKKKNKHLKMVKDEKGKSTKYCSEFEFADDAISLNSEPMEERPSSRASVKSNTSIEKSTIENPYVTVNGKEELPCVHEIQKICISNRAVTNKASDQNNKTDEIDVNNCVNNSNDNKKSNANAKSLKINRNFDGNYNKLTIRNIYSFCTLPKNTKKNGGKNYQRGQKTVMPPKRVTPDGTSIYYWCDLNKKYLNELGDGAYNPLWTMRGFTQTFHFWKENKRAQSVPLNAFLTYVTLPWWSIAKDILDHREGPILTF